MQRKWYHPTSILDKVFEGGIILKGITGGFELLGGLLLIIISPAQIHNLLVVLTKGELSEDPHSKVANYVLHTSQHVTGGTRIFAIVYLLLHATVKLIAVIGILKNQLWAYPFSLVTLGALMLYQVYSIVFVKMSFALLVLTIFDVFILVLIWLEYGKAKQSQRTK